MMYETEDLNEELMSKLRNISSRFIELGGGRSTSNIALICTNKFTTIEIYENLEFKEIDLRRKIFNFRKRVKGRNEFEPEYVKCPDNLIKEIKKKVPIRVINECKNKKITNHDLILCEYIPKYYNNELNSAEKKFRIRVLRHKEKIDYGPLISN